MAEKVAVDSTLLQRMVSFIGAAGEQLQKQATDREQTVKLAAEAVNALIQKGLLGEERKQAAVEALADNHAKTLDTLKRAVSHVKVAAVTSEKELPSMGKPMQAKATKTASSELEAADQKFLTALGW